MRKKSTLIILAVVAVIFVVVVMQGIKLSPILFQLLFNKDISIIKQNQPLNVLLLGVGGGTHDGPDLTDTIILTSIDPIKNKITLVSIPRDLWVPDLKAKINTAYTFGEEKQKGGGLLLAKAVAKKVSGQTIDYAVKIDFNGFVKAVNLIGGIDVTVDQTLDDYAYPVAGKEDDACGKNPEEVAILATSSSELDAFPCRYEHIHFEKGVQHLTGEQALKFVRSRHALGSEGTDFARSKRQEKIIKSFKDKVFSLDTFSNPGKVISLYSIFQKSIDTDIPQDKFDDFVRLAQKVKTAKLQSAIIDYGDSAKGREGLLVNPQSFQDYGGQWVLIPKLGSDDFSGIHAYVVCMIDSGVCDLTPTPLVPAKKTTAR